MTQEADGVPRPISADDQFRIRWLSQPRLSPDGERAAVTVTWLDRDLDRIVSQVGWLATGEGSRGAPAGGPGNVRTESSTVGRDGDPRWAPDGRTLAFVSDRSGSPQVWVLDTAGGAARSLTASPTGASGPAWSPDGGAVAFVAADPEPTRPTGGYTVAPFHWRADGVGIVPGPVRRHVWVAPVTGGAAAAGDVATALPTTARQLTDGDWDDDLPRFSPDGRTIAFRSNRTADRATSSATELWLVPVDGGEARLLVPADGAIRMHAWSPDGRAIAFIGNRRGEAQGVNNDVWVVDVETGAARNLTGHLDRPMGQWVRSDPPGPFLAPDLAWAPAGDALYVIHADGGTSRVVRVDLDGRVVPVLAGEAGWFAFDVAARSGTVAALGSRPDDPGELVICAADGSGAREITSVAAAWRAGIQFGRLERFELDAPDGMRLEAWIQHPAGRPADERLPLILHVHGGPHWPLGVRFGLEFRRLAEQGYRVLYLNPRGSSGYGDDYAQANVGDWGGIDAGDLLAALDVAAARPDVDPERLGVTGESYGGFMTNWLVATTDRFAAAVAQNCISDFRSEYLTTDDPPGFDWDMGGAPWAEPERYERLSPISRVTQIRTPLLLVHSEQDQNCPINQSEQLYTALRLLGRTTEFLRIPGEGHLINLVGRPSSRLARIEATDRWFGRYLARKGETGR